MIVTEAAELCLGKKRAAQTIKNKIIRRWSNVAVYRTHIRYYSSSAEKSKNFAYNIAHQKQLCCSFLYTVVIISVFCASSLLFVDRKKRKEKCLKIAWHNRQAFNGENNTIRIKKKKIIKLCEISEISEIRLRNWEENAKWLS